MKLSKMLWHWPGSFFLHKPFTCNVKITQRCNLKCHFCGLWSSKQSNELYLENYITVAKKLKQLGVARVVITGGEPFLRQDLTEITSIFSRSGFSTTLLTNGTLATRSKLERLKAVGLNDIGVSLDTLNSDKLNEITGGKDTLEKVIQTIRDSVRIFKDGVVEVLITITGDNLDEIPELVEYINSDLNAWAVINPVNIPAAKDAFLSAPTAKSMPPFPEEKVDTVFNALKAMKKRGSKILVSDLFMAHSRQYLKTGQSDWKCDAGTRYFTIFSDGSVAPCSDTKSVGNIMDLNADYFRSKEYQNTVKAIRESCGRCIFSCWREASYLFTSPAVCFERLAMLRKINFGRKKIR